MLTSRVSTPQHTNSTLLPCNHLKRVQTDIRGFTTTCSLCLYNLQEKGSASFTFPKKHFYSFTLYKSVNSFILDFANGPAGEIMYLEGVTNHFRESSEFVI